MRGALLVLAAALLPGAACADAAFVASAVPMRHAPAVLRKGSASRAFQLSAAGPIQARAAPVAFADAALDLDAAHTRDTVEEITVFGKRRALEERAALQNAAVTLGGVTATGAEFQEGGFSGLRVTAAVPVGGVRGLDAVASLSAGHDQVNANTTRSAGAALVGLRWRF